MSASNSFKSQWVRTCLVALLMSAMFGTGSGNAQGPREGIKVHGHWAIDIRQPDGTLVTHKEFENALLPSGGILLSQLLGRGSVPGGWTIVLWKSTVRSTFCSEGDYLAQANCFVGNFADYFASTVQLDHGALVLTGTKTASQAISVAAVSTILSLCDASVAPATCTEGQIVQPFSGTWLQGLTPVAAGQIIQVTVTLTFS